MDSMQPGASQPEGQPVQPEPASAPTPTPAPIPAPIPSYMPPEPISGGVKAVMVIISILLGLLGSLIAWIYGARNAERDGATLVRIVGMIFTVIWIMSALVFGAAMMLIPGFLMQNQDLLANQVPTTPPAAVNMQAGQPQGIDEAPPEIAAKIAELRETVASAVQTYHTENGVYPTLDELNAAGLLDERFTSDPAHPEQYYIVQVQPWTEAGKPGCNINVQYTGPEANPASGDQQAATVAETPQEAASGSEPGAPVPTHGGHKRGAARWQQYL